MSETADVPGDVVAAVRRARRILVLTGAGMSAESGLATFRDAQSGLWETFDPSQLATPEAWAADPPFVWAWYAWRIRLVREATPNAGHRALADLASHREVSIVTQNIDDLHERAGSAVTAHLHGSLLELRCVDCQEPYADQPALPDAPVQRLSPESCQACGGDVRPGVVWFGEMLPPDAVAATEEAIEALQTGDVCLVVGTSGLVYPAAGYPAMALSQGATVIEVNPDESGVSDMCHHTVRGTSAQVLPALLAALSRD